MAIKEYKCEKCGFIEEFILTPSLPEPKFPERCSKCGEGKFEYNFNADGISFKIK